jgi:hypothetical protein
MCVHLCVTTRHHQNDTMFFIKADGVPHGKCDNLPSVSRFVSNNRESNNKQNTEEVPK